MAGRPSPLLRAVPVVTVIAAFTLLMYPLALLFGMPLARQRMENLANWVRETSAALPLAQLPQDADAAAERGRLRFFSETADEAGSDDSAGPAPLGPREAVLVQQDAPLDVSFTLDGGDIVFAPRTLPALLAWGEELQPVADVQGDRRLFRFGDPELAVSSVVYLGDRLLRPGAVLANERADGVRTTFTFPVDTGPVAVGARLLGEDEFSADGAQVTFATPPAFNAAVRRVTGDYVVLDAAVGTIGLVEAADQAPRAASGVLSLAERLVGPIDGNNRTFSLQHAPLIETDPGRRLFVDAVELSPAAQRPQERVDGVRASFTFGGERGIVTVDGVEQVQGRDYVRRGDAVDFTTPPPRNAALRQYADYLVSDLASGTVTLASPPPSGSVVWVAAYSFYDRPACGETAFECFLSLPQHPVPFPHWIAQRIGPFFTSYPLGDTRNVVSQILYTATGTLTAMALGALAGVLLAVVFVWVRPFERALLPWVIASQTIPVIALVPVLVMLLGNAGVTVQTSLLPTAIIGAYIAFFPVTVGTVTGLRSVDPLALDLMKGYAASPWEVFVKVRFPAAVPFFFTSLKLGAAAALVGALVAEVESNNRLGLGYAIIGQVQAGDVADVWILLLIAALLGIGLVGLVGLAQRWLAPWQRTEADA